MSLEFYQAVVKKVRFSQGDIGLPGGVQASWQGMPRWFENLSTKGLRFMACKMRYNVYFLKVKSSENFSHCMASNTKYE